MSKTIPLRSQLRNDFPKHWWRSARWWGGVIKEDATALIVVVAPVLLPHKAVQAVRYRRDPAHLARFNGEGFTYGLVGSVGVIAMLTWVTAGRAEMLPLLVGLGSFLALNALVSGTVVGVLATSLIRERCVNVPDRPSEAPDEHESDRTEALLGRQ